MASTTINIITMARRKKRLEEEGADGSYPPTPSSPAPRKSSKESISVKKEGQGEGEEEEESSKFDQLIDMLNGTGLQTALYFVRLHRVA